MIMEVTMKEFVDFTLLVTLLVYTAIAAWILSKCRNILSGTIVTAVSIVGSYGIYQFAYYIAMIIIWTIRFAAVMQ